MRTFARITPLVSDEGRLCACGLRVSQVLSFSEGMAGA